MNIIEISNNIKLSKETNKIIKENKGYRSEVPFGSGVRSLIDVIDFEIGELGNSDIVLFCNDTYNLNLDLECGTDKTDEYYDEELDSMIQENHTYYTEEIMDFISKTFNCEKEELEGIWLASKEAVNDFYCKDEIDKCIDTYELPEEYLIISDIGFDGVLIAYMKNDIKNKSR